MATIPLGNAGRATPGRAPVVQIQEAGTASGRAVQQLGNAGVQAGIQFAADQTRLEQDELRRQQATSEAAARAKDALQLQQTEDKLTDLHDEIGAGVLQGSIPKADADKVWRERSQKVTADALPGFRDTTRELVQPRLAGAADRLGNTLRRTVEKKDRQDVTADMTTRLERLSRDYQTDPQRAETEAMALLDTLGPFSTLTSDQVARARQGWKEQAQYTTAFEAVSRGRNDRKALATAETVIGKMADIDPQRKAQLLDRVQNYRMHFAQQDEQATQRAARQAEASMRRAQAEFQTFQGMADKGTVLAPEYIDRVMQATAGTPYQAGIRALAQAARDNGGLAAQPVPAQRATLTQIDALIAQQGRTPELDKRREQVERVLQGSEADLTKDALRAGLQRGVITDLQPLQMTGGLQGVAQQLTARVQQAQQVERWAGRSVSPVTVEEAQQLGGMLRTLAPAERGNAVALLSQTMPARQAQALAKQMDAQDKPLALALAVGAQRTTQGRTTAELILRGAQVLKDRGVKEEQGAEFGLRAQLAKAVGEAVPAAARDDVLASARFIYLAKQGEGEGISYEGAVRLAIGGDIVEHNGRRLQVPAGVNLSERLQRYPRAAIEAQAPGATVYLERGRPMGVPEFLSALPSAQLEPSGQGRYMVRSGGSLVLNADRQPIIIEVAP